MYRAVIGYDDFDSYEDYEETSLEDYWDDDEESYAIPQDSIDWGEVAKEYSYDVDDFDSFDEFLSYVKEEALYTDMLFSGDRYESNPMHRAIIQALWGDDGEDLFDKNVVPLLRRMWKSK